VTNCFYVYTHTKADTGEVFYVGKGKGDRAHSGRRNAFWKNVAKKHGHVVNILAAGLYEEDAFALEKELIAKFGRSALCNLTDGGEGVSGYKWSDEGRRAISENLRGRIASKETREKLSQLLRGKRKTPEQIERHAAAIRGRKLSPAHIEALRLSLIGHTVSNETRKKLSEANRGQRRSEETKRKLSESHLGNTPSVETRLKMVRAHAKRTQSEKDAIYESRRKSVCCSNGLRFESLVAAVRWLKAEFGCGEKSSISKCALGHRKSVFGFSWGYAV